MVAQAAKTGQAREAAMLAVLLTERGLGGDGADLDRRLIRFRTERSPRATAARQLADRLATQALPSPSRGSEGRARPVARPGMSIREAERGGVGSGTPSPTPPRLPSLAAQGSLADPPHKGEGTGALLIHAWPDRVAKARGERGRFVLANGSGAMLDAADPLAGEAWLVIADLQGKAQNARVAAAAAIGEADIRATLADKIEIRRETSFDRDKRAVRVRETVRLGAIVLSERMLPAPTGADADRAILDALREHGLSLLGWNKEVETLRQRLGWLHRGLGAPWPDVSDRALTQQLDDWLLPFLSGAASFAAISSVMLSAGLMALVPHDLQRRIETLAPTHFDAPSGSHVPIRYDGEWPVLAIRVQELFGLDRHPAIANGTVPLTLELLSPAHRPIQTTRDLPGFWRGSWADVRADMRGRYPKHVWPENPLLAAATSRAKPRGT
jgi:ATP-dependent helicase HrpB